MNPEAFLDQSPGEPPVRGFLHRAENARADALVLTHSAGGDCTSALLVSLAEAFCGVGITVLRCDLPFRQRRPKGPPLGTAKEDQSGLRRAMEVLRPLTGGRVFLGGHSYGGRMATMLAAQDRACADGLLLLSYPLHPPRKPNQLRTVHFPDLHTPSLFMHGSRDPFASQEEMRAALQLIPAKTSILEIEGAGHELIGKPSAASVIERIIGSAIDFFRLPVARTGGD